MPRISAASFRFQRVRVSIRRISSRSASRAAVRAMSFSETLPPAVLTAAVPMAAADATPAAIGSPVEDGSEAKAADAGGGTDAAGGGTAGCDGATERNAEEAG